MSNSLLRDPISPILVKQGFLLLDGGLATSLEHRGFALDQRLWSASLLWEHPEAIRQLHYDFYRAGADVAISASYQLNADGLLAVGRPAEQLGPLIRRSVALAGAARDAFWARKAHRRGRCYPLVAASVGPYGAALADGSEYHGRYGRSREQLRDWHRARFGLLATSGAEVLAMETIPSLVEAQALLDLLDEQPDVVAWMSFSCRDGRHLRHGEPFAEAVSFALAHPRVLAAGLNCSHPRHAASLLREANPYRQGKPLLAYPNRGERWDAQARTWKEGSAARPLEDYAAVWLRSGAHLLGGCCRTGPEDIKALRTTVEASRGSA